MSRIGLFILALSLFAQKSYADIEDFMPQARHAQFASQGRDCAIYRTLSTKARLTLEQSQDAELHFSELLKVRRADLIKCAELRGIELDGEEENEELAAEVCGEQYEQWVKTGFRLRSVLQDSQGAKQSIDLLTASLERDCARPNQAVPAPLRVR